MFGKQGKPAKAIMGATTVTPKGKPGGKAMGAGNVKQGITPKGIKGNKNKLK
jgi:hypothetical protein